MGRDRPTCVTDLEESFGSAWHIHTSLAIGVAASRRHPLNHNDYQLGLVVTIKFRLLEVQRLGFALWRLL
jgi:hypothetical protein